MAGSGCSGCGEIFNSVGAFDYHRIGDYGMAIYGETSTGKRGPVIGRTPPTRRCMTIEEMIAKGMTKNDRNRWVTKDYEGSIESDKSEEEKVEV